ncbi:MAG: hypothetical protein D6744_14170 [Planctomycetota bacterium]|nr:MAG: hypothetical protein D6744_14170 [Planctomycetota bacterium]
MKRYDAARRFAYRDVAASVLLGAMLLSGCRSALDAKPPESAGAAPAPRTTKAPQPTPASRPAVSELQPASETPAPDEPASVMSNDGAFVVRFKTEPSPIPSNELFEIIAEVATAGGESLPDDADLQVDAAMPEHNHGMITRPKVTRLPDGRYRARGMLFHMPGRWVIYFDVTRGGVTSRAEAEVVLE